MIELVLPLLPLEPDSRLLIASCVGALVGLVIWLAGSRFSRYFVAAAGITIGAYAGLKAPGVFSWKIDPIACAFAGALALGLLAVLSHRVIVAWLLGLLLSLIAIVIAWVQCGAASIVFPSVSGISNPELFARELWASIPPEIQNIGPHIGLICVVAGWGAGLLWPRFAMVWFYSMVGLLLMVLMNLCVVRMMRPSLVEFIPPQPVAQAAIMLGLMAIGMMVQWRMLPKAKSKGQDNKQPSVSELAT